MKEKIYVTKSSMPSFDEYVKEIEPIFESRYLTNMGACHQKLERQLCKYLEVENVSLFVNGHMALEMAIQAMGLDGEVITSPFTFASTTHAIVRNGLTPVFCDIDPMTYTIDSSKIEALITDKTSAIIPIHVYGNICNVEEIETIAEKYNLKVIYDAAHAFGVKYKGKGVAFYGDAVMFSFHATKVFHTIEGGAICCNNSFYYEKLYGLKNFGIYSEDIINSVGANAKMNEFQAAMGICNLRHIDNEIKKRKLIYNYYRNRLKHIKGIYILEEQEEVQSNYAYFPIRIEPKFGISRENVIELFHKEKIYPRKYFYPITNHFDCYRGKYRGETPIAACIAEKILVLPIYADLRIEDATRICDILEEVKI